MRAFIFSLDAFVAFTLALVAIYSLIFFSSIPSAYYYLLTQGHYLSRDTLLSLSSTPCTSDYGQCINTGGSILDNIVSQPDSTNLITNTVGVMVPSQFGYIMEMSSDGGENWQFLYDTSNEVNGHATSSKKLSVSTQLITFGYSGQVKKLSQSPYNYLSCGPNSPNWVGGNSNGDGWASGGSSDFGIITCGEIQNKIDNGGGDFTITSTTIGNTNPSDILGGALVPSSDVRIVRLTIFI